MNDQAHHEVVELLTRIGDHLEAIQAESRAARGAEQNSDANCSTPSP